MGLLILAAIFIGFARYFLPTIIAAKREHSNTLPIFALNLLLRWSFLGWVAALVWSLTYQNRQLERDYSSPLSTPGYSGNTSWKGLSTQGLVASAETLGVTFQLNSRGTVSLHYFGDENPLPPNLRDEIRSRRDEVFILVSSR
ncbi:MAG: superinfection immunity protein [Chloroflexi bacterium]|nr:superinfection immunity protein [Chloroflexota bacterium]